MRKISKILSLVLCLALCLTMGVFASGEASGASEEASGEPSPYGYAGNPSDLTPSGAVNLPDGKLVLEDQAIISVGGSAVQNAGKSDLTVRDSVIVAIDAAPTRPLAGNPGNLLVAGNVRTTLALSQGQSFYVNSSIIGTNWAALSTDGAVPVQADGEKQLSLYAYGTYAATYAGGYGAYSDLFCNLFAYGSEIDAAEIGIISGTYGRVVVGTIADGEADPAMAAHLTDEDKALREDKDTGSVIAGGRNAIMIHSVNLPPYWEYEGYSKEELPLYSTPVTVSGSTLRTDLSLDAGVAYPDQKQAYIDHTAGSVILVKSTNAVIILQDSELIPDPAGTGALIQTVYNNDTMFMNTVPEGETYPGVVVFMEDMDTEGDIIHEDYQRDLNITLTDASLTGAVNGYDCDHWKAAAAAEGFSDYALDESYATPHGVFLTLSGDSRWTVTGESTLSVLIVEEGASIDGTMTVDGTPTPIVPGTYVGQIVLTP